MVRPAQLLKAVDIRYISYTTSDIMGLRTKALSRMLKQQSRAAWRRQ